MPVPGPTARDAIAVDLPRLHPGHERVPVVVGAVGDRIESERRVRPGVIGLVEEQQFDPGPVT